MELLPYYQKQIDYNIELLSRSNERQTKFINDIINRHYKDNKFLISCVGVATPVIAQSFISKLPINSTITIIKFKEDDCIFTTNKGKKEYKLPIYRILNLIQE